MRTEANKMHKSIPLRKQETHSASLMTDLGSSKKDIPEAVRLLFPQDNVLLQVETGSMAD